MKAFLGGVAGAVAVAALLFLSQACAAKPSSAFVPTQAALTNPNGLPLVNCGDGRQAVTRQIAVGSEIVPQVDCVPVAAPFVAEEPVQRVRYSSRVVEPTYTSYRPARTGRVAYEPREYVVKQARSWKKSALIIGGSAAGGAGIGALVDGVKGAKKGAVIGGAAGVIYDLATRNK